FSSGCKGIQSALDPAGPQAERLSHLWWLMFWVCAVIYVLVMSALIGAILQARSQANATADAAAKRKMSAAIALALGISVLILFSFMLADFSTGRALTSLAAPQALKIEVTGYMWWWDFKYDDPVPSQRLRTANEIHIPVGRPVHFVMTSRDVIHSFWVPNLQGKTDLLTGHTTTTWLQADRAGTYRGQCAEYCGHQHAHMAFLVIAEPEAEFKAWLDGQRRAAPAPVTAEQQQGLQLFQTRSCVMCHQIRGTGAGASSAPDLTHLASRQTLAAGTLANNRANLGGWILDPQHFKPGNKMPANALSNEELNALVSYLESLK
ncbi:MAG: cytochrome c oxidase subunit II, partial [Blastocatellia bacterium]